MTSNEIKQELQKIIDEYNLIIRSLDKKARKTAYRAYGGLIRAEKGGFVENTCKKLIELSWQSIGGNPQSISFDKKVVKVPLNEEYIYRLKDKEVKSWIKENTEDFHYNLKVDVHTYIKDKFVMAIECKAYTENAVLKRILLDFTLLKKFFPDLHCILFQLEGQLEGNYSQIFNSIIYGSRSTHALMPHFDVDLQVITLLGERKVDQAIHKEKFFKELKEDSLMKVIQTFSEILRANL
ncbi:MAG: hypothetical protein RMJ97_04450 [Raineya sp.]|nr:hypothetical protein [Raineya sp.]